MVSIAARDIFGRSASRSISLRQDMTLPELRILSPAAGEWTGEDYIEVSGTVDDAYLRQVSVNQVSAQIEGETFRARIPVNEGSNSITVIAEDWSGNRAIAPELTVHVDQTAPEPFSISTDAAGWTNNRRPILEYDTIDAASGMLRFDVSINGQAFVAQISPYKLPFLDDGKNTITVRAIDQAGNSRDETVHLYIDTLPPDAPENFRIVPGNGSAVIRWTLEDKETESFILHEETENGLSSTIRIARAQGKSGSQDGDVLFFDHRLENQTNGESIRYSLTSIDRAGNIGMKVFAEVTIGRAEAAYKQTESLHAEYEDADIFIPAGSLEEDVTIIIQEVESAELEEASFNPIVSPIYDFSTRAEHGGTEETRHHTEFTHPYMAMLAYDEAAIPEELSETRLGAYYYSEDWGQWFLIEDSLVDTENNLVVFSSDHFSFFTVQPTLAGDLSPQELRHIEYSLFPSSPQHNPAAVGPQGGSVSTSMTEFVLPGRDGFDFELRRIYDTGTARMDASALKLNYSKYSKKFDTLEDALKAEIEIHGNYQLSAKVKESLLNYFRSNGDYSYALGQGWRLNLPYIRRSSTGLQVRSPSGSFYDVLSMTRVSYDSFHSEDNRDRADPFNISSTLILKNTEYENFTLKRVRILGPIPPGRTRGEL